MTWADVDLTKMSDEELEKLTRHWLKESGKADRVCRALSNERNRRAAELYRVES